ncbi:interleukin-34 isoform X1 [Lates japonicus]
MCALLNACTDELQTPVVQCVRVYVCVACPVCVFVHTQSAEFTALGSSDLSQRVWSSCPPRSASWEAFWKHNFPINYTIRVHQKEVFKLSNISRLKLQVEGLDELVLQRLWFQVNQGVLKKIIRVLPERHPSRSYTAELERRFMDAEGVFVQSHPAEAFQQELPETIQDIWDSLTEEPDIVPESSWRFASPKSLLDNFCQTMYCLFSECFASTEAQQDYCGVSFWRKGRKKDLQPES